AHRRIVFVCCFQAEDGIRDGHVTGVQTCALPILSPHAARSDTGSVVTGSRGTRRLDQAPLRPRGGRRGLVCHEAYRRYTDSKERSEERRVGKECRFGWAWWRYNREGRSEAGRRGV